MSCGIGSSPIGHADFLRPGLGAFFFCGFGDSEIQAGGSLAGNDSSEASSTGSGFCGSLLESRGSRSDFGGEDFCFSAGLAMVPQFYRCHLLRVIG